MQLLTRKERRMRAVRVEERTVSCVCARERAYVYVCVCATIEERTVL